MRVLYLDIDCLRPDHLGCYGYHRATSPHIDRIAAEGVRFDRVYVSDAPCLPSRTALFSGRFGIHTGAINHGGTAAELFNDGPTRGFGNLIGRTSWMRCLRDAGLRTVTVSSFAERHAAWHWCANFSELHNPGRRGLEIADDVEAIALEWIERHAATDGWFLHVNLWDPHTPYRTPAAFGDPFADEPLPAWLTEEVRAAHWAGYGPHSAREVIGFTDDPTVYGVPYDYPRQPRAIDSMDAVRRMFDGYDTGVLYADRTVGRLLDALAARGVLDDTAIIVSADHGENLGELNVYGDHQTADEFTTRVPLIIRWPGVTDGQAGRVDRAFHYQLDFAATVVELVGGRVPAVWDGESFAGALRRGAEAGRPHLVLSQGAWTCQRAVRFARDDGDFLWIRTFHDGYHDFPDEMLFDLASDPHEQRDLAAARPDVTRDARARLEAWHAEAMRASRHATDPMWTVLREGGPYHVRGRLPAYLDRLRATGRAAHADRLAARHGG